MPLGAPSIVVSRRRRRGCAFGLKLRSSNSLSDCTDRTRRRRPIRHGVTLSFVGQYGGYEGVKVPGRDGVKQGFLVFFLALDLDKHH
ncbi:uncharacterized protein B0T23DRAFT_412414 [Neurospora hispaniola]|uniref:Uncharacterized protein n=1 Tax=Neurospora hispaniola TaxID=588809 RepID=A0AAJ0I7P2_9PEZI|nr:hypothetical protein B0T23DRAFT_412414 [Neurospora hispaniola]